MKALIKHLWETDPEKIVSKSLVNCHAAGVDSIVFDGVGKMRLFYADRDHDLWKPFEVALHPHHCDITIIPIEGSNVINISGEYSDQGTIMNCYLYESGINGKINFKYVGPISIEYRDGFHIGDGLSMKATNLHTIKVPKNEVAAWFVFEGKENEKYIPVCYSPIRLDEKDFSYLYKPMSFNRCEEILKSLSLID